MCILYRKYMIVLFPQKDRTTKPLSALLRVSCCHECVAGCHYRQGSLRSNNARHYSNNSHVPTPEFSIRLCVFRSWVSSSSSTYCAYALCLAFWDVYVYMIENIFVSPVRNNVTIILSLANLDCSSFHSSDVLCGFILFTTKICDAHFLSASCYYNIVQFILLIPTKIFSLSYINFFLFMLRFILICGDSAST